MKTRRYQGAQQRMAMTPQLLQSIRLLQLSAQELDEEVQLALEENLMLDAVECEAEIDATAPTLDELPAMDGTEAVSGEAPGAHAVMEADFDASSQEGWSGGEPVDEDGEPWTARLAEAAISNARIAALRQLQLLVRTPREAVLVATLLDAIDDNGYLAQPLDGIQLEAALEPAATLAEVEAALALVQSVEPSGFGARDLRECLRLQLQALPSATPHRALALRLVAAHLDALAGAPAALAAALGLTESVLRGAIALIRSLNPKPAAQLDVPAEALTPDVVVNGAPGAWKVSLHQGQRPSIRVNAYYEQVLAKSGGHTELRQQLQEARWLVRGLQMRNDTLMRTACAVFERQQAFLERGEEGLVALTLREIAEAIGMHESTISRVTTHKWVQTPWGVYAFKAFFPSQLQGAAVETSGTAVKAMIRRLIDEERPHRPLSDGDIAALLARRGIRLARRTVAKYREAMGIAAATLRGDAAPARRQAR